MKYKPVIDLSLNEPIKLENIPRLKNIIARDTYLIYPTGGKHFFKNVDSADSKYSRNVFPYVERINRKIGDETSVITPGVSPGRGWYPVLNLDYADEAYESTDINGKSRFRKRSLKINMHKIVAEAFIPNPEGKPIVHHINDDKCDYRIHNLCWRTHRENSTGTPKETRKTPEEIWKAWEIMRNYI